MKTIAHYLTVTDLSDVELRIQKRHTYNNNKQFCV